MGGCLAFPHTPMIDCCNALLQIPKRDVLLSFELKEIDHIDVAHSIGVQNVVLPFFSLQEPIFNVLVIFFLF